MQAKRLSLGDGLMSVQDAPKAVSTITRDSILQAPPGATYAQMIQSIPGVLSITDDVTGLNDANYKIRGFTNDEIGVTVNGAPINDSGNYRVYPTEYGDTENITTSRCCRAIRMWTSRSRVPPAARLPGRPSILRIRRSCDLSLSGGSYAYNREFLRVQTGDTGPVRSWLSYSDNEVTTCGAVRATPMSRRWMASRVWNISDRQLDLGFVPVQPRNPPWRPT